jgi:hypothetical protein
LNELKYETEYSPFRSFSRPGSDVDLADYMPGQGTSITTSATVLVRRGIDPGRIVIDSFGRQGPDAA